MRRYTILLCVLAIFGCSTTQISDLNNEVKIVKRKSLENISIEELTLDTQVVNTEDSFNLVWWIPSEFWATAVTAEKSITLEHKSSLIAALRPYSMFAIVQADVTNVGTFEFYDRAKILKNLKVQYKSVGGEYLTVEPLHPLPDDVQLLLEQMKPMLAAAMGSMGKSVEFVTFLDVVKHKRTFSPYKKGEIKVSLLDSNKNELHFSFLTPLNSLFVPRVCPNGKDAHISWKYCPWGGSKL